VSKISLYKILVIARHEFITTITRPSYLFMTLGMPVVFLCVGGVEMFLIAQAFKEELTTKAAVIDRSGLFKFDLKASPIAEGFQTGPRLRKFLDEAVEFQAYDDLDRALDDLAARQLFAVYVIEKEYIQTGRIETYIRETRIGSAKNAMGEYYLAEALRAGLLEGRLPDEIRDRALHPARFNRFEVLRQGGRKPEAGATERMFSLIAPVMLCTFLSGIIFLSSGYLMQSLILENQNRVMEVLLCSVRPTELLLGKMTGLGVAGFIPAVFYGSIPLVVLTSYFVTRGWKLAVLSVIYFLLGYMLYSIMMTATGVVVNGMREGTQLSSLWAMGSGLPVIVFVLSSEMNSWAARVMAWFPLTAPTTMLIRLCYGQIAQWDILLSILSLLAGILLALWLTIKLFRTSRLMYGQGYSLRELGRWFQEA
jgi:ABC-2 type transport system permease protein